MTSLSLFTFMHWRRKCQPTPVFLPGESQGLGSLVGCHLWGRTELDTTEATRQQQQQQFHPCCYKWHYFVLSYSRVIFHCICVPCLFYPRALLWTQDTLSGGRAGMGTGPPGASLKVGWGQSAPGWGLDFPGFSAERQLPTLIQA